MARITAPPRGNHYKIKKSGHVEGLYYLDGN